jgi:hypothetical protein
MEIKRVAALIIFSLLLISGFMVYFIIYLKQPPIQGFVINNGRDGHGCLYRSGYAWDNSTLSCIKESGNNSIIYQITDFKSCLDAGYAISEDNKTHQLQCQALNGTLFIGNSTNMNATANLSNKTNTLKYPDYAAMEGNFMITNATNSS